MHKLMEVKRHDNNTKCELHEDDSKNEILSGSYFLYRAYCIDSSTEKKVNILPNFYKGRNKHIKNIYNFIYTYIIRICLK